MKMVYSLLSERSVELQISGPEKIGRFLSDTYGSMEQEVFIVVPLDSAHNAIEVRLSSLGTANKALSHPRETFRPAIASNAVAIIVGHNHPSGELGPSLEDVSLTQRLIKAGELLGIPVLDHIIFSSDHHYSFMEHGRMREMGGAV